MWAADSRFDRQARRSSVQLLATRRSIAGIAVVLSLTLFGCGTPRPSRSAPAGGGTPPPTALATASAAPLTTPIAELPPLLADLDAITRWCGPSPDLPEGSKEPIWCSDGIELALRALGPSAGTTTTATHMYGAPCPSFGTCGAVDPDRAHVVLVSRVAGPLVAEIRRTPEGAVEVYPPRPGPAPDAPPAFEAPPVARPELAGAPPAFATREPYPFCGRDDPTSDAGPDSAARSCFVTAVRAGSPAEFIEDLFSVEGDPVVVIYRFSGAGAVMRTINERQGGRLGTSHWASRTCAVQQIGPPQWFGCD